MNKLLKWIAFGYEGVLAIPFLGGAIIVANGWTPLLLEGILHLAALILLLVNRRMVIAGNLVGLAGALLGWIPLFGWILHTVAAVILFIEAIYMLGSRSDSPRYR
ncbi:hypothetical protein [Cohnella sp. CFH 77786]|uniref:hypothetical protein n=1 Tax=Cohnella sp. CFH 77786 TaxID=2662265 RepID=UPI0021041A58|nr:hypothetical protein [Cohnella sp. CFH 77786]